MMSIIEPSLDCVSMSNSALSTLNVIQPAACIYPSPSSSSSTSSAGYLGPASSSTSSSSLPCLPMSRKDSSSHAMSLLCSPAASISFSTSGSVVDVVISDNAMECSASKRPVEESASSLDDSACPATSDSAFAEAQNSNTSITSPEPPSDDEAVPVAPCPFSEADISVPTSPGGTPLHASLPAVKPKGPRIPLTAIPTLGKVLAQGDSQERTTVQSLLEKLCCSGVNYDKYRDRTKKKHSGSSKRKRSKSRHEKRKHSSREGKKRKTSRSSTASSKKEREKEKKATRAQQEKGSGKSKETINESGREPKENVKTEQSVERQSPASPRSSRSSASQRPSAPNGPVLDKKTTTASASALSSSPRKRASPRASRTSQQVPTPSGSVSQTSLGQGSGCIPSGIEAATHACAESRDLGCSQNGSRKMTQHSFPLLPVPQPQLGSRGPCSHSKSCSHPSHQRPHAANGHQHFAAPFSAQSLPPSPSAQPHGVSLPWIAPSSSGIPMRSSYPELTRMHSPIAMHTRSAAVMPDVGIKAYAQRGHSIDLTSLMSQGCYNGELMDVGSFTSLLQDSSDLPVEKGELTKHGQTDVLPWLHASVGQQEDSFSLDDILSGNSVGWHMPAGDNQQTHQSSAEPGIQDDLVHGNAGTSGQMIVTDFNSWFQ